MTGIEGLSDEEVERRISEGQDVVLGGIEIHAKFVRVQGNSAICIEYLAPTGAGGNPEGIKDINERLAGLCREKVMAMKDRARNRLMEMVARDGGKDRMIYRFVVTSCITDDGLRESRVSDLIDPEFGRVDAGVEERARQARREIEQMLEVSREGLDEEPDRTPEEMFEILPKTNYPLGIKEQTEEEARRGILEGEEFMLIQIQVIGSIEKYGGKDSLNFDYIAAISEKAVSSPWMKEKIQLLSKVCEDTVMGMNRLVIRRLFQSIRKTEAQELCIYRLSVLLSMKDDGSHRYDIRDQIDPVFTQQDSAVEKRAAETRRLAGMVMEEKEQ
jgi:hypothetical protein